MHTPLIKTSALLVSVLFTLLLTGCPQDAKPDIVAGQLTVLPTNPVPTVPAVVSMSVRNDGNKEAGAFAWTVTRDGSYNYATGTVAGLAEGGSTSISFTVLEPTASTHTYQVIVNSDNAFEESDLNNNSSSAAIGFGPTAVDPQVTSLMISTPTPPQNPTVLDNVVLSATVLSPITATNAVTNLNWTLSGTNLTTISGVIPSIAPGQTIQQTINVGTLSDSMLLYSFVFTITPGVTNADIDATNNSASINIDPSPGARAAAPILTSTHLSRR